MISKRIQETVAPAIEDVLDKYSNIPDLTYLAIGSTYYSPPSIALETLPIELSLRETHRYGNILGYPPLIEKIKYIFSLKGLSFEDQNICITAGANQGFNSVAMALTDANDHSILLAPYYLSHLANLQIAQSKVDICSFDNKTLELNWNELEELIINSDPKMVRKNHFLLSCFEFLSLIISIC
jgi:aspartate/methionine/tyrosine aminotransferase